MKDPTLHDRYLGALIGTLVGDALGVPVEFTAREVRNADPVTDMRGFGTWNQPPGTWSDDGAMTLVTADVLVHQGWDTAAMMEGYRRWLYSAWWTARGTVFDVGATTARAIDHFAITRDHRSCGLALESSNGNGSLMRCIPVSLWLCHRTQEEVIQFASESSSLTHAHPRSRLACAWHALWCQAALTEPEFKETIRTANSGIEGHLSSQERTVFARMLSGAITELPREAISGDGYVISTLEASIWCLGRNRTFADTVLAAVNLGEDTDTTGAVVGGMAGWRYGVQEIPRTWIEALPRLDEVNALAERFAQRCVNHG